MQERTRVARNNRSQTIRQDKDHEVRRCSERSQHWPKNLLLGNGCLKSSLQVVKFGFVYASIYLMTKSDACDRLRDSTYWLI